MCVISYIRSHIYNMQPNEMCFSRDFQKFGLRTTIDTSLWRLVGQGLLLRVASGVFVRYDAKIPTAEEIAKAKSARYGKTIVEPCQNIAADFNMEEVVAEPDLFGTDAQSGSFDTIHGRVKFVHVSARKRALGQSRPAKALRALWAMRRPNLQWTAVALSALSREEVTQLSDIISWAPAWISNQFTRRIRRRVLGLSEQISA